MNEEQTREMLNLLALITQQLTRVEEEVKLLLERTAPYSARGRWADYTEKS